MRLYKSESFLYEILLGPGFPGLNNIATGQLQTAGRGIKMLCFLQEVNNLDENRGAISVSILYILYVFQMTINIPSVDRKRQYYMLNFSSLIKQLTTKRVW